MKKILSIASLSLLFFACSDDSSSTSPTNEVPESSSAAIENTDTPSSETVAPESSADVSVPGSSSSIAINLNIDYKVDPVSSASAYSCTTTPLTFGSGVDVTCDDAIEVVVRTLITENIEKNSIQMESLNRNKGNDKNVKLRFEFITSRPELIMDLVNKLSEEVGVHKVNWSHKRMVEIHEDDDDDH